VIVGLAEATRASGGPRSITCAREVCDGR
jgi:hypothetical protein